MQDLIYHVNASLDGFIARPDGSPEGLVWDEGVAADFMAAIQTFGTVLMGRKTYDLGLAEGKTSPYPFLRQLVVSQSMRESPDEAVELWREDVVARVTQLKAEADAPIWLCGGGSLAGQLLAAGLIDRVIVKLSPVVFGVGIPLFGSDAPIVALVPEGEVKTYDCGVRLLSYAAGNASENTSGA